jgi:DnaJ-class molecular chaperone
VSTGYRFQKWLPCRHCEGRGQYHGYLSNDPGERPGWHSCSECGGTGCSPYLNIPDHKIEDEHDERV